MAITNNNRPLLNRKEWQMMTPAPVASAAAMFIVPPDSGNFDDALLVQTSAIHYLYSHAQDGFTQIPSGALAGTFGAGSCGVRHPWSIAYTATGGTTTTATVALNTHNISGLGVGQTIEFLTAGTNFGVRATITDIKNTGVAGDTITITFGTTLGAAVANGNTFRITTGRYYVLNAGTQAAGSFRVFDVGSMAWQTNLTITGLPATWGTDGKLVLAYNFGETFGSGTASAGAGTTLTDGTKSWTTNQWSNYQVRITAGTGIGQVRHITSNTGTVLTVPTWTTNPDATSVYVIEASEDYLYALGNNAVTMYRYSISGNSWSTLSPGTARTGAPVAGMTASAVGTTGNATWALETDVRNGRYIYSLRGAAGALIDRYDIALNAWAAIAYVGTETFTTGSSAFVMGRYLYIRKDATNRFFRYDVVGNIMKPFSTNLYTDGAGVLGHKIWVKNYDAAGTIRWLYSWQNTGTAIHRVMVID